MLFLLGGYQYTKTEASVGIWIDGKTIYRQIIEGVSPASTLTSTQVQTFSLNVNVKSFISCRIMANVNECFLDISSIGMSYTTPFCNTRLFTHSHSTVANRDTVQINWFKDNTWLNTPYFIVVEYTKV